MWRRIRWGLVLGAMGLALLGAAQQPLEDLESLPGPFLGLIDEDGTLLLVELPGLPGIALELGATDLLSGEPLAGYEFEVYLEPTPGITEIRGPWDIAAILLIDPTGTFEPEIATELTVSLAFREGKFVSLVSAGELFFSSPPPCTSDQYRIEITGENEDFVQFHYWYCQDGVWQYQGWVRAIKVFMGPPEGPELGEGQWVAVVSEGAAGRTYRFFGVVEGEESLEIGHTVPVGEALPPGPCQPCEHFLVEEGDTRLLYHCEAPGKWELVREWQVSTGREEEPPEEEEPPPEEEEPPPVG